jgi:hypothetical protein
MHAQRNDWINSSKPVNQFVAVVFGMARFLASSAGQYTPPERRDKRIAFSTVNPSPAKSVSPV